MSSYVAARLRRQVRERACFLWEYCLIHEQDTFLGCQVEHIISEKHGGETIESNLALACVFCNRYKGSDIAAISRDGTLCRLYNPRSDHWADHFRHDRAYIVGISGIGEATASLLALNHADRILERESLMGARRYPPPAARRLLA